VRVHRFVPAALVSPRPLSHRPSRIRLAAVGAVCGVAAIAAPVTVLVTAGSASAEPTSTSSTGSTTEVPAVSRVTLSAPPSVTKGRTAALSARLTLGPLSLAGRAVQFVSRAPGVTAWTPVATVKTDRNGIAFATTRVVTAATQFGVYYADSTRAIHSNTATAVVHTIDMKSSAPSLVAANTRVSIAGRLLKDGVHGVASQSVKVWLRTSASTKWSAPMTLRTNSRGIAVLARKLTRTTQVGIRFLGANGLASSPLAISTIKVKTATASASGFVFPFANPRQAEPAGNWSQDQGVDMFARGNACGASAILVAVGDGVVIQEGISGFGPTAPVLRMTSGPYKGRNVYYGHTGHVYVGVGAHVRAGQRLAQIGCGRVGYSSGPHLEIGVGVLGGPPCCPSMRQTSGSMLNQLIASLRAALS
jgi:murein DD-endopeptidase MepM/ murein hydrolase activator NlpD